MVIPLDRLENLWITQPVHNPLHLFVHAHTHTYIHTHAQCAIWPNLALQLLAAVQLSPGLYYRSLADAVFT